MQPINTYYVKKNEKYPRVPLLLLAVSMLMVPIGGTGYVPIVLAYAVLLGVLWREGFKLRIKDSAVKVYARYYFSFLFISVLVGLLNGVSFYAELADIVSSTVPFVCMYIGYRYALRLPENKLIKTVFILLLIETLVGVGQTVSPSFREFSFKLYGATDRLVSYEAEDVGRAVGTIGSPNYYGILCVILCVSVLPGCIKQGRKQTALLILAMGIACVIFSVSKTSVLCIGVSLLLWIWTDERYKKSTKALLLVIGLGIVAFSIGEFQSAFNRSFDLSSMSGRNESWASIIDHFLGGNVTTLLLGYGNGYSTFDKLGIFADSFYVVLLIEQGLLGVIAYAITWLVILWITYRMPNKRYRQAMIIIIVVLLMADVTAATTDNPNSAIPIYFMLGRYMQLAQQPETEHECLANG